MIKLLISSLVGCVVAAVTAAFAAHSQPHFSGRQIAFADKLHSEGKIVTSEHFDLESPGTLPAETTVLTLGSAAKGKWTIRSDHQALSRPQVLAHEGSGAQGQWDLLFYPALALSDGEIEMAFKPDQAAGVFSAGIVWRYIDAQSFYLLELSSADDEIRLYRFKKGKPKLIDTKSAIIAPYRWHTARIDFAGRAYVVYLDDELVMGGTDKTWLGSGRVALAADGAAGLSFDNWVIRQ